MGDNKFLVSYIPRLGTKLVKSCKLDLLKVVSNYKDKELQQISNSSIAISTAATAYARFHKAKLKLYILSKSGNIYYSYTDNIVTDLKLYNTIVGAPHKNEIGKVKLEHEELRTKRALIEQGGLRTPSKL